ncbi:flagellar filament capping protein FliD [Solibacillus sp. CAU 1738]|uniref:flagellar filament capping protein FliD n=1 Tax=Solibacillus sp. CAU 1738 TaxID=3140363 RepID=UPI003260288D
MASTNATSFSYLSTAGNRFTGLASGMDIDSIVEKLMKAESAKMEKLQQQKQKYEWQRDSYRDINRKMEAFRTEAYDKYKPSSFLSKTASVSDSSKVSVIAGSSAAGLLEISSVTQLAKNASANENLNTVKTLNGNHKLSDLGIGTSGAAKFTINNEEKSLVFNPSDSINSIVSKLKSTGFENAKFENGSFSLGQDVKVTEDNIEFLDRLGFDVVENETLKDTATSSISGNFTANSSSTLKDLGLDLGDKESGIITFNVLQNDGSMKATSIEYKETDTIDQLVKQINGSGAGVTAIFSNGQLSLSTVATGEAAGGSLQVSSDTGKSPLLSSIGFSKPTNEIEAIGKIADGQDAKYTINGIEKTSHSNTFTESGYSITLKQTMKADEKVTISSSTDTNSVVDKVKSFVELYNGLVESLNNPIKERKDYNYKPLTDAEKSAMSEDEIKKWEEKAKQGLLRNDNAISTVVSEMRTAIYSISTNKDDKYNTLFNMGITTSDKYTDGGKLVIDEEKLRKAIETNPDAISDLFTRTAGTNGTEDKGGLVTQLRSIAKTGIDSIATKAGKEGAVENSFTLGKNLISVESKITEWKTKLKKIEERYFKQFSAMEQAIQKANSQSSMFAQG